MGNSILNKARYSSNNTDEWYTDYKTIENEGNFKIYWKWNSSLNNDNE